MAKLGVLIAGLRGGVGGGAWAGLWVVTRFGKVRPLIGLGLA